MLNFEQQVGINFIMGHAAACLLAIYLGLSPVYWWPGVPTEAIALAKFLIIASTIGLIVLEASRRSALRLPAGLAGPLGFLLLVLAAIPGVMQGDGYDSLSFFKDVFLAFTMMWAVFFFVNSGKNTWNIIYIGAIVVALHCVLVVSNAAFNIPGWIAPPDMRVSTGELSVAGFTALRTGWSQGVALYVPILVVSLLRSSSLTLLTRISTFCFFAAIIGSQLIVAGRAGLLASTMQVLLICILRKRIFLGIAFAGVAVLAVNLNPYAVDEHLRFDRLSQENKSDIEALDSFSAGRLYGTIHSWKVAMTSPVLGHGFGITKSEGRTGEIHNVWLRLWVESGIVLPVVLAALVFVLLRKSWYCLRIARFNDDFNKFTDMIIVIIAVLLGGLLMSFFSPRTILGAFQNSAVWWVCAGTLCGLFDLARKEISEKGAEERSRLRGGSSRRVGSQHAPLLRNFRRSGTFPTSGRTE